MVGETDRTKAFVAIFRPRMVPVSLDETDLVSDDVTTTFITAVAKTTKGTRKYICKKNGIDPLLP